MLDENNMYVIQIPANVKTRMEIINGVGIKELIQTTIAGVISIVIAYIVYLIKGIFLLSFGIVVGITILTFLITMKDKYNQSIAIWIGNMIKFFRSQRMFVYVLDEDDINEKGVNNEKDI